jgi:hypothetical protein
LPFADRQTFADDSQIAVAILKNKQPIAGARQTVSPNQQQPWHQ